MTDKINIQNTEEYKKIFESINTENDKIRRMQASKLYYKSFPELRPARKEKKVKPNYDSISYLQ